MIQALLTIDDIPSVNTCAIVDYLNEAGIQAIMFAEGEKAEKNPEPVIYALQHGMIVGNHSWSHPHFSELSLSEGIREMDRCEAVLTRIYDMAGMKRTYRPFRFPYGDKGQKTGMPSRPACGKKVSARWMIHRFHMPGGGKTDWTGISIHYGHLTLRNVISVRTAVSRLRMYGKESGTQALRMGRLCICRKAGISSCCMLMMKRMNLFRDITGFCWTIC